ncbi:hypothetical protein [Pseudonocardia sp. Ae717_Ps2]|uniref:hypothetical protein n=1 Tax=Pseudonocardia sp. Ae717_Ps2 TaxID=1885573 RepID=UPI00117B3A8F|nr:hypothetical protein [Pseudonocardia sp. Ae717_Ps2]
MLFCDYATATGQPALPTTVATLVGFFAALPARPATQVRRVRAIAAAHRWAGHLLARPQNGPAALPGATLRLRAARTGGVDPVEMIAACATRGWPHGLHGRRDAFLIVTALVLNLPQARVRGLVPAEVTLASDGVLVGAQAVPAEVDPRRCPACAVVRWLEILGVLDGLGRGSARMDLTGAHAAATTDPHRHECRGPQRWRAAATLLPAIDRHGWHDDYQPITTRTIRTRLALAATRATQQHEPATPTPHAPALGAAAPATAGRETPSLEEALTLLDDIADDADALNDRILALLNQGQPVTTVAPHRHLTVEATRFRPVATRPRASR